jgi:hypothetical protein
MKIHPFLISFLIDRRTAMKCRSVVISVCDSSSTRDPEIVTSNSTRAIKSIAANTARLPSHAGLFGLVFFFFLVSPWSMQNKISIHQKPVKRRQRPFLNKIIFFGGEGTSFDMMDYSSSIIAVFLFPPVS